MTETDLAPAPGFQLPAPIAGAGPLGVRVIGDRGPVVVLIHGLGRVAATWKHVAARTAPHIRLVLPDNPGFGTSQHLDVPSTVPAHASLHAETLASLGLPPPYHCCGLSLGGMIAPALADALGDRAGSVVMFSASSRESGFWRLCGWSLLRMAGRALKTLSLDHRVNMPELVRPEVLARYPNLPRDLDSIQNREGFSAWNGFKQLLAATRWKIGPHVQGIPQHRLVVVGSSDRLVPPSNSHRIARLLGSPIQILEGRGHDLSADAPEDVARILVEWSRSIEEEPKPVQDKSFE